MYIIYTFICNIYIEYICISIYIYIYTCIHNDKVFTCIYKIQKLSICKCQFRLIDTLFKGLSKQMHI